MITDSSPAIQSLPILHDFSLSAGKRHLCSTLKTWFFITHTGPIYSARLCSSVCILASLTGLAAALSIENYRSHEA